jgi:hypothetical protein
MVAVENHMKKAYCLMGLVAAVALTGCDRKGNDSGGSPDSKSALEVLKNGANQGQNEFVATMGKKMKDLDSKIDELAKRSGSYKDDAKAQADKALAELRSQREVLARKFDDLGTSGQDTWEKAKAGVMSAWGNVEKAYDNAKSKFN